MSNKLDSGFVKASSGNLPIVDSEMVNEFYAAHIDFLSAEMRNQKTKRAARECYGDNAVEYVQVKRNGSQCVVKGNITPEHKIHKKAYEVIAIIDEEEKVVSKSNCMSCAASLAHLTARTLFEDDRDWRSVGQWGCGVPTALLSAGPRRLVWRPRARNERAAFMHLAGGE
ncbi:unnamed protein product [Phaedon cochleariae]|uniref:Uncharacterized protein n=1 Tax=Phaedon cochleariae TaxID=80249 RepID=A0A9N9X158_PHACE|nr:unnamed protein product [Phaedon cochleariae]